MDYQSIYEQIKASYQTKTGETIRDDGDIGLRMQVVSGELATLYQQLEYYQKQLLPQTATGDYLVGHAECRGLTPQVAAAAVGSLTFSTSNTASQDITIPVGTLCTASGGNGVVYATVEAGVLATGQSSVTVSAQATSTGSTTNIKAGAVDTMVGGIAGIESVTNSDSFSGGCEDEDEELLRERLVQSFVKVSTSANAQFYEDIALAISGVHSAKAVADGNDVTVYITDIFRTTSDTLLQNVQTALDTCKAIGTNVTVAKATSVPISVSATIYVDNLQSYTTQQSVAQNFLIDRILYLGIGDQFNPYSIASTLDEQVDGLQEIVFTSPTTPVTVDEGKILMYGTVAVGLVQR